MLTKKKVSFAIPVFRNKGALPITHKKIRDLFTGPLQNYDYEIVFVDDGSDDGSYEELMELRKLDACVKVVSFTRNFGQMAAILAAFKHVSGDVVINVSADLQDPIELVEKMVNAWAHGNDVVIAYRQERRDSFSAALISRIAYSIIRLSLPQIPPGGFDYLLMDRKVLDIFNQIEVRNRFLQGDVLWLGYPTAFIPYIRQKREIGKSQYTFGKRLKNFLDAVLDSSYLPIRFISLCGIATALVGFLYILTIIYSRFTHSTPFSGWAPIMVAQFVIGGVIMIMLGIIGEYVWRIYDEIRKKPNYIIKTKHLED